MIVTGIFSVSFDFRNSDVPVLMVMAKDEKGNDCILNAITGQEAKDIVYRLINLKES